MKAWINALVSPVFVVIWSTGFIVGRYGLPYIEPGTFLSLRFAGVLIVMVPVALLTKVHWPDRRTCLHLLVAGMLLHAGYLGGIWSAIKLGMGAGVAALIAGMQPLLTAVAGRWMGDVANSRQWLGLLLGLAGVALVVADGLSTQGVDGTTLAWAVMGLISITAGTLYQRRYCPRADLRASSILQFAAALSLTVPFSLLFETRVVEWNPVLAGALLWSVLGMSIGAVSLLLLLIRHGAATKVSSLMYLTPSVTAMMAWVLFGEVLTPWMIAGMAITGLGVAWAQGKR